MMLLFQNKQGIRDISIYCFASLLITLESFLKRKALERTLRPYETSCENRACGHKKCAVKTRTRTRTKLLGCKHLQPAITIPICSQSGSVRRLVASQHLTGCRSPLARFKVVLSFYLVFYLLYRPGFAGAIVCIF